MQKRYGNPTKEEITRKNQIIKWLISMGVMSIIICLMMVAAHYIHAIEEILINGCSIFTLLLLALFFMGLKDLSRPLEYYHIEDFKRDLAERGIQTEGCTKAEIIEIQKSQRAIHLPEVYIDFLKIAGKCQDVSNRKELFYPDALNNYKTASEWTIIPKDIFIVCASIFDEEDDDIFIEIYYFKSEDTHPDPTIYLTMLEKSEVWNDGWKYSVSIRWFLKYYIPYE